MLVAQRFSGAAVRAAIVVVAVVAGIVGTFWFAPSAAAHSFLVSTAPAQGQRVGAAPDAVVLDFSERVDRSSVKVRMQSAGGNRVALGSVELADGGLAVRVSPSGAVDDGVYIVSWEAFSAIDGHGTFGEFAFGVGRVEGSVPASSSSSTTSGWSMMSSLLFLIGFASAAGLLTVSWLDRAAVSSGWIRVGLSTATVGSLIAWWERLDGRGSGGLVAATIALGLLLVAVSVHALVKRPVGPLVVVLAAAAAWSARSHVATANGVAGAIVDFVHLAAGGIWVGALVAVAARVWRAHRGGGDWRTLTGRYSRLALVLVLVLALAGVVSAVLLVPTWEDLRSTDYGRLLVIKIGLFALAIVFASVGRWGGLARRRRRLRLLRVSMSFEVVVLVAILLAAGVLANVTPPAPASAAETLLGPPPLEQPISRDAGLGGQLNVEVTSDGARLDVRVFSPSGPVPGTEVSLSAASPGREAVDLLPRPCGTGCFTLEFALLDGVTTFAVDVTGPEWTGGRFVARLHWPVGPEAADRLREVIATTRQTPRVTVTELVDSGPGSITSENSFEMTGDALIDTEPYAAGNLTDVRRLPGSPERLSLYVPGSQIYVELVLDERGRMVGSRLISPGHEVKRTFAYPTG